MRTFVLTVLTVCAIAALSAQQGDKAHAGSQYAGVWAGTWEGAGSGGGFELTLEMPKEGPMIGRVSVTGEPTYKATLKTLSFEGARMTGGYDFPADDSAEVVLTATFDGGKATGDWLLREKAAGTEVASGSWKVARR
jgi:hypothetical protein